MSESQLNGDPARADIVRLIPALRAFARTFCRNPSDADDLVQETLMKALANLDKFEPGTKLKSWLFTIMRNTFYTRAKVLGREAPGIEENYILCNDSYSHLKGVASHLSSFSS